MFLYCASQLRNLKYNIEICGIIQVIPYILWRSFLILKIGKQYPKLSKVVPDYLIFYKLNSL